VIAIGRQLASALAAAHAKGVVHRDLKPGNVQLTPDGTAKVLDFGIANAPRAALATSATATTQNGLQTTMRAHRPGTPPYMSPEQLLGRPIDARSDIYSLGVVLFEMATGRRPFPDSDALQVVVAQAAGAPRADAIDRRLPRSLGDVIDKALAMDVTARYQTAAEIGAALVEVERGLDRQREPVGKKLARVAVGVLIAVPTIGLLGVIKTIGFNNNFGRTGPFARFGAEPWTEYFRWGSFGIIGKVVTMTATAMIVIGALFVIHMLELIAPVGRVTKRVRAAGRRLALALDLDKPSNLAQAIAAAGIVAIVVLARRHIDLLNAFGSSFNSAPIATLLPMREAAPERGIYQVEMSILTLALAFGFYKVIQLRQRLDTREGRGALAVLGCVIAITVVMADAPYRSFNYRDFERVDYAGARCYVIGESGDDFLLLCPGSDPPRDRAVRRDDPRLHRLGIIENVFRGIPAAQNP
jgi:hypothetical protein